ncbi:MAG: hypothetical protein R2748_14450 [Bryobacterales bacterium]
MKNSRVHYLIRQPDAGRAFSTAVSLHSHTMHSKESMTFVERLTRKSKWFSTFIDGQLRRYSESPEEASLAIEVRRMWWTSPLSASQAFKAESQQIEESLGLNPIVSITDHDNIDAPLKLQSFTDNGVAPISVEWTTPYRETYFHMGVHNLHPQWAREMMARMEAFTAAPTEQQLSDMFHELHAHPGVLIVLNHPYWDQPTIGNEAHEKLLRAFVEQFRDVIDALEINGLRSWKENRKVVRMANETGIPLISGGDRHGREPNAVLNLTNAATFGEFAEQLRSGAPSEVLVMPQFHDPLVVRILHGLWDVLEDHPEHAEGRVRWSQRVYRRCWDDQVRPFEHFFPKGEPFLMRQLLRVARFTASQKLRPAWQKVTYGSDMAL